jgi:hypothetical protein
MAERVAGEELGHSWLTAKVVSYAVCRRCHCRSNSNRATTACEGIFNFPEYPEIGDCDIRDLAVQHGIRDFNKAKSLLALAEEIREEEMKTPKSVTDFFNAALQRKGASMKLLCYSWEGPQ